MERVWGIRAACSVNKSGGGLTYRDAGVDIEAGAELVRRIQKLNPNIGGFGGLFPLGDSYLVAGCDGVGTKLMLGFETNAHRTIGQDLVAMSVNDIVTTGAKVRTCSCSHSVSLSLSLSLCVCVCPPREGTIPKCEETHPSSYTLVYRFMCVCVCVYVCATVYNVQPLFFLDYFGTGALDVDVAQMVVEGIADACERSDCLLLGGEVRRLRRTNVVGTIYTHTHTHVCAFV